MISVELALALGVTDSASTLSYPCTNELVHSVIKAVVYAYAGDEDVQSFSAFGRYGVFRVDIDFHKCLHIVTHIFSGTGSLPGQGRIWGCRCRYKHYARTELIWISLADFNVNEYKLVSVSPRKFSWLIIDSIDGQETQGSWHYPTTPPQLEFPTYIEALSHQIPETV